MITKVCDICKEEVDELKILVDEFKVEKTSDVCRDCLKEIQDLLDSVMKAQRIQRTSFIRRFIKKKTK